MRELRPREVGSLHSNPGSRALPFLIHLFGGLFKTLQMNASIVPLSKLGWWLWPQGHGRGLRPGETLPLTIDPLPPNQQTCESKEEEDTAHHCLPLVGTTVHLCEGLMELEPVHWRQVRGGGGGASGASIPRALGQLLASGTSSLPLPAADAVHSANSY